MTIIYCPLLIIVYWRNLPPSPRLPFPPSPRLPVKWQGYFFDKN